MLLLLRMFLKVDIDFNIERKWRVCLLQTDAHLAVKLRGAGGRCSRQRLIDLLICFSAGMK